METILLLTQDLETLCRACLATMGILYYRIAQGGFGDDMIDDEQW